MSTDIELQEKIIAELNEDRSFNASHIAVAVKDYIAILSGYVPRYVDMENAEHAVKRVSNIKATVFQVEVKLTGSASRSDLEIAEAAVSAINADTTLPKDNIKIAVTDGRITLDGEVQWRCQYEAAENCVRHLPGVRGLSNQLTVAPLTAVAEIKLEIN